MYVIACVSFTLAGPDKLRLVVWIVSVILVATDAVFTASASNAPVPPDTVAIWLFTVAASTYASSPCAATTAVPVVDPLAIVIV